MDNILIAINAVVPFLCYISFGYLVRAAGVVDEPFMRRMNQMVFRVFFPVMMFYNLYHHASQATPDKKLVFVSVISVLLTIFLAFLTVPRIVKENAKRGVIIQAIYRSNFVLFALPLSTNIFGDSGAAIASAMIAIIIPIYNIFAILILEYFRGDDIHVLPLLKRVLSNPMIFGALVGLLFIVLHIHLPACLETPISQFSDLTTPLALFILGSTLRFSSMLDHAKYLIPTLAVKLLLLPACMLCVTIVLDFEPVSRFVYLTMFATPVAAASYPMAANMGGDGALAGELVVASTAFSVVTLFFWIFILKSCGLI